MSLGMPEMIVIVILVLVLFGPDKLPDLARSLSKGIREFRKITSDFQNHFDLSADDDKPRRAASPRASSRDESESGNSEYETSPYDTMHLPNIHGTRDAHATHREKDADDSNDNGSDDNESAARAKSISLSKSSAANARSAEEQESAEEPKQDAEPIRSEQHELNTGALRQLPRTRAPQKPEEPARVHDDHAIDSTA